jgi:hypothetical protein
MRYMNGSSLSERIKTGIFSIEQALLILGTIAPALDEAHSKGIVHRDIKPSNILFDKRGNPYVSDFGIAKLLQAQAGNVTGSGIIGTPAYMAPEQAQGMEVDGRADIYALGIILFEMLTGKQPYEADTPMAVAIKHITDPVPPIRQSNPKLPEGMEAVIQKAMAKNKNDRFSTAVEMTDALREVAQNITTKQPALPLPDPVDKRTVIARPRVIPQKRAFNPLFVILPAAVLVVAAGAVFLFNRAGTGTPARTEPPASTFTAAPPGTATFTAVVEEPTDAPVVLVEPTSTETTAPPTEAPSPTQAPPSEPSVPVLGGADKIALVANNDIWLMNVDGSELIKVTEDGGVKTDLQWLPDGETLLFLSGLSVKTYNLNTNRVETLTSFPSAAYFTAFRVSNDGKQVMLSVNNEIFVVPFDVERLKNVSKKSELIALEGACILPETGTRSALIVKEARWSRDDQLVAWLYRGVTASDQVSVLDIHECNAQRIDIRDTFPGVRFNPPGFQGGIMLDFDWNGTNLFSFHTSRRNEGWGELHIYNWESLKPTTSLNPIGRRCCYRDVRWSPDGSYLLFAFQDESLAPNAKTALYYVPFADIAAYPNFAPIPLPEDFFPNPKEAPQPALRPAQ